MDFDPQPFLLAEGLGHWLLVVAAVTGLGLLLAMTVSIVAVGLTAGPKFVLGQFGRALKNFALAFTPGGLSHVFAIAQLTIREAVRRKALWIFAIFALLFMFAGWFLQGATVDSRAAAKPYILFVFTAIQFLSLPLAILLSCWGLPQDIKARSLHTVVTKPVRRVEIVLGRIVGYSTVVLIVVAAMAAIGYVWIQRTVPDLAQSQLIGRDPVFGELSITDRYGKPNSQGISVGNIWEYRQYLDGNSRARGVYRFDDLPLDDLRELGEVRFEYDFEVFRTHKGDIETGVQAQFEFVNDRGDNDPTNDLRVRYPDVPFEVKEFTESVEDAVQVVERMLLDADGNEVDLLKVAAAPPEGDEPDGLISPDGVMEVQVRCVDANQYMGVARRDLFIRMPDKPFWLSYLKAAAGIVLQTIVLVILGTTASTVVKGPVATFLTLGVLLMSFFGLREYAVNELLQKGDTIAEQGAETTLGGGPLESVYRLVTHSNQTAVLAETPMIRRMKNIDKVLIGAERGVVQVVPDFNPFDTSRYLKSGFDVPWDSALLPALMTTLGFLIPCVILGGLCLQMRELEAK